MDTLCTTRLEESLQQELHCASGFVSVKCIRVTIFAYYFTPSESINDVHEKLDILKDRILKLKDPVFVAANFNVKSAKWGTKTTNYTGIWILGISARRCIIVIIIVVVVVTFNN